MTFLLLFLWFFLGIGLDTRCIRMAYLQRVDVFGTLRTYQRSGCDDEVVSLNCPSGTSITIEHAQYGKSAPEKLLCAAKTTPAPANGAQNHNITCLWPNAIQTVVEACQKKRQCKFQTSPRSFGGDPCPGTRKYVEVAYKCRPYEFRSKVACENERIQLKCNPNSRVAVYSASFGRTEYESIQCPQPQGVPEETCLVTYATETVMQFCHGKRSCDLVADIATFGTTCKPESRMYLKVVYTCVPRHVLKEQYEGKLEPDETEEEPPIEEDDFDHYDAGNEYIRESAASPPTPNIEGVSKDNFTKGAANGSSKNPPHQSNSIFDENQERFFLYLIMSIAAGLLLLLSFLVGRLLLQRHRSRRDAKFHATNISDNTLPNGFTDEISEVDADIDLTTPLPCPPASVTIHSPPLGSIAEVVRYPHVHSHIPHTPHTFRRPSHVMETTPDLPRSLSSASNSHYYYG